MRGSRWFRPWKRSAERGPSGSSSSRRRAFGGSCAARRANSDAAGSRNRSASRDGPRPAPAGSHANRDRPRKAARRCRKSRPVRFVNRDPYSFIFRYSVVRPILNMRAALPRSPPVAASARGWPASRFAGSEITGDRGGRVTLRRQIAAPHATASERRCQPAGRQVVSAAPRAGRPSATRLPSAWPPCGPWQCFSSRTLPGQS